jgi:Uma2 family endonuclease
MGMPTPLPSTGWTVEMLEALPDDGNRHEIIDGELFVTPSPSVPHQRVLGALLFRFYQFLRGSSLAEPLVAPADVRAGLRTVVQPDLLVVRRGAIEGAGGWPALQELLLAVEVLSPSSSRLDRWRKRLLYQREGVPEYWIVDPDARLVERWRPGDERPEVLAERIEWRIAPEEAALVIDLEEMFAEVAR